MVKNWTVALKLKLKLHLWGTLCLVKSLWFNKKNLQKTLFDSTEIFSIPPKFTAQNLVEKKIIIPYPSLTTFLLVLTFSYYYYLLGPIFAHSISVFCCRVWIEYRCLSTRATAAPEVSWFWHRKCKPKPSLSFYETRLQKIRIVKVFSHCASFSIFVNHHPKCFVLCFKNTNPFLKRTTRFLLSVYFAN